LLWWRFGRHGEERFSEQNESETIRETSTP
jgi:hypothetical protein